MKTLSQKQIEFARMVARLLFYAECIGIPVKATEWHRTRERQRKLYEAGLSRTLWGKHQQGLAIDLAIIRNRCYIKGWKQYEPLGLFWEAMGGTWGGRWDMSPKPGKQRDAGHFEYKEYKKIPMVAMPRKRAEIVRTLADGIVKEMNSYLKKEAK